MSQDLGTDPIEQLGPAPEAAAEVFGDRLPLAAAYAESLATEGIERGLIGPREVPRIWERHVLNSAVLGGVFDEATRVVDIGSGAGLPGIPLAIARPDLQVQLVEPLLRRTVYLDKIVGELGLDIEVVRGRAEEPAVRTRCGGADYATSRAVAPLGKLARWSLPLVRVGGSMRALKGSSVGEELARDARDIEKAGGANGRTETLGAGILQEVTHVVIIDRKR